MEFLLWGTYVGLVLTIGMVIPWTWSVLHVWTILALAAICMIPAFFLVCFPLFLVITFVFGLIDAARRHEATPRRP